MTPVASPVRFTCIGITPTFDREPKNTDDTCSVTGKIYLYWITPTFDREPEYF